MIAQTDPTIVTRDWWLDHGVRIGIVLVVSAVLLLLARLAVRRVQRRIERAPGETAATDLRRMATVTQALSYLLRTAVWTVAVLLILGEFNVNVGPLIAGAGIAGVALGFGAQSLVRDFLSGFFILLEDQFGVDDTLDVAVQGGTVSGKVEHISLRRTVLRAFDGTLYTVPNGNILWLGNRSRGWARAIVDVAVPYAEDLEHVRAILAELFEDVRAADGQTFVSGPTVLGVERMGGEEVVLRVVAEVRPSRRAALERELRERIKVRFADRGIGIRPLPT